METELQIAFAIQLAVFGVAHILRPGALVQFFAVLGSKGEAGVVVIALLSLVTGSFLVAFHNVWTGLPIILTVFGWAQLVKGTAYLLFPTFGLRQLARVTPERTNLFRLPGIPLLIMAGLLAWHVIRAT
ncbi:MAG: hypothetical protein O3C40_08380 [Planctomycetota bacterium]|nr:hypothetical protein [Planctomycetota bacterium]